MLVLCGYVSSVPMGTQGQGKQEEHPHDYRAAGAHSSITLSPGGQTDPLVPALCVVQGLDEVLLQLSPCLSAPGHCCGHIPDSACVAGERFQPQHKHTMAGWPWGCPSSDRFCIQK